MNHNLDDLIIDEPEVESPKSKSVLSKVALIIIVLIVGVVISKLIISDKGDPVETVKDKELSQITDPSQTDPEIAKLAKEDNFENGFDKELEPLNQETPKEEDITLDDSNFDSDYAVAKPAQDTPPKPTQNITKPTKPKPQAQKKPISKPTKPVKKEVAKKTKPTPKKSSLIGKYFIQVGSFSKMPTKDYLNKIKQKGYTPFVVKSGNLYKVRVGPFDSWNEAKAKLQAVNEALDTKGFVLKRK